MESTEYPLSKNKLTLTLLLMVGPMALSLNLFNILDVLELKLGTWASLLAVGTGVAGLGLFGFGTYALSKLLARSGRPALSFGSEGLTNNSSLIGGGFFRWSEIADIRAVKVNGVPHLGVFLRDPEGYLRSQSGLARWALRQNCRKVGTPVLIAPDYLDTTDPMSEIALEGKAFLMLKG